MRQLINLAEDLWQLHFRVNNLVESASDDYEYAVNSANGLPMDKGRGGIDILGNPYGTNFRTSLVAYQLMTNSVAGVFTFYLRVPRLIVLAILMMTGKFESPTLPVM